VFEFIETEGGVELKSYNGKDTTVVIPDVYEGKPVRSIGDGAFSGITFVESVVVPVGVRSIGNEAFRGCYQLTSVSCRTPWKASGITRFTAAQKSS
jgi:hypothetical protein